MATQRPKVQPGLRAVGDERARAQGCRGAGRRTPRAPVAEGRRHGVELASVGGARSAVDLGVLLRVPPAQLGTEGVAGDVVRVEPPRAGLDEREAPQPGEHRVRVGKVQQLGQQRLRRRQHLGASLQGPPVLRARDGLDERGEEGVDHSAQLRRRRRLATLRGDIGHQGEGEGVAAGEGERARVVRASDPAAFEKGRALLPAEVPQLDRLHQPAPPGIRAPGHRGWVPAGEHRYRIRRERRQQLLAQPAVQRGQPFGGVDQQQQSADPSDRLLRILRGV